MSRVTAAATALLIMLLTTPAARAADPALNLKLMPTPSPPPSTDLEDQDIETIEQEVQNATAEEPYDEGAWEDPPGPDQELNDKILLQTAHVIVERAIRFAKLIEKKVGKNWMGPTRKYLDSQLPRQDTKLMCKKELLKQMLKRLSNSTETDAKQAGPLTESIRETYRTAPDCAGSKKE